ncbi:MAG: maleylpyruvate isomerase family mycothiol-dependent enzyme [Streptomycetaceae bacterium]|nr:maleylpyruvate isomerase family mycothiol-dependent enzyme [Streptomycetaceae bacterium]
MAEPVYAWDHRTYCDLFVEQADRLAEITQHADLAAEVPTCPGWTLGKLLKHVGIAHVWSAANVRAGAAPEAVVARSLDLGLPEDPADMPAWLAAGARRSADYLREVEPDAPAWTFGPDKNARFWSRRMLHETLVHRIDAELALGNTPGVAPGVAVDAIDELLTVLPGNLRLRPADAGPQGAGETLHVHTSGGELPGEWTITLTPDGYTWDRGHAKGDAALRGDATGVLLAMHRRVTVDEAIAGGGVEVFGDRAVLDRWLAATAL